MSDSVGSVSVEVVPDARGWSEKLRAQIRDVTATVKADADTAEANAELDKTARTRTAKVKADVSQLSKGNDLLGKFADKLGFLPALAIAAGAALVPLAATIGGLTAAIAAPLVVAGGGAGLFAVLAGFAIKDTEKQLKNIDSLQKKLTGLTKGTKTYVETQKELKAAQAALTPAQRQFEQSLGGLSNAFEHLIAGKSGQAMLGVVSQALDLLAKSLPVVAPLLDAVSHTFGQLLGELGDKVGSKGFADFVSRMAHQVGPDLTSFAHILGNFTIGLGGLFGVLDKKKFSGGILDGLEGLSKNFRDFGTGSGGAHAIREFFDYFHRVAPGVGSSIDAVAQALGHVFHALAPLGPAVFKSLELAADALSKIPVPVLTALAAATVGLTAFNKLGGFKATGAVLSKLTSGKGIAGGLLGGVQKVYVVNLPPGEGLGGLPGGKPGTTAAEDASKAARFSPLAAVPQAALLAGALYGDVYGAKKAYGNEKTYAQSHVSPPGMFGHNTGYVDPPGQQHFQVFDPANHFAGQVRDATAFDALRAGLATTARGYDLLGHSAAANSASVVHSLQTVAAAMKDLPAVKQLRVIADTQSAIHSLEALQAYRIQNKSFTVYQRSQALDRTVGPGGGIGVTPHTGGGGSSGGGRDIHTHVNLDGRQIAHVVTPIVDEVYHANRTYEDQAAGR